ncbi:MAG TPA: potassium channel family protein [Gemmataceae bacterium]|nr:potassium channel family protein [Gemmataceae bacterium]
MTWLGERRFLVLLIALLLLILGYPIVSDMLGIPWLVDVLLTFIFAGALAVVFRSRRNRIIGLLLGIPTICSIWAGRAAPDLRHSSMVVALHVCAALFFAFTIASIMRVIHREKTISADSIYGAFCGYLLVGLAFGHLFALNEVFYPGSLQGPTGVPLRIEDQDWRHFEFGYFSFITLTTVGYGDVTPINESARALAVVEAIVGQFYIAVLMAELIGKRVAQALSKE